MLQGRQSARPKTARSDEHGNFDAFARDALLMDDINALTTIYKHTTDIVDDTDSHVVSALAERNGFGENATVEGSARPIERIVVA